ncbi:MAG TPA: hypothetical protein VLH35_01285 [Candidatus Acidoferrales bacterium]|nr:hypothetical protein [Candidatus Acidoferrales bacterium]
MENKNQNLPHGMDRAADSMARTAETMSETIIAVLDKLAGKQSDIKLSFEQLTFDTGIMKATVNGAIVLDVVMAKEPTSA